MMDREILDKYINLDNSCSRERHRLETYNTSTKMHLALEMR